ncbi:hypothetical protein Golax_025677 [Gossypium laxum]|uniref:RNase H type-1 domain-containing protein n=1 Tax=Gossypium laxum TaxID=34288 RepID=A0A7J9B1I1_9ROSI|nr:hypothetical protein [Gossypium laxum]
MTPIWKPLQEPFVKVNFDAAFKATLYHSYSSFDIMNSTGLVMGSRTHISFHHVDRQANMVPHMIAKERILLPEDRFWMEELPAAVEAFLARDLSGLIPWI